MDATRTGRCLRHVPCLLALAACAGAAQAQDQGAGPRDFATHPPVVVKAVAHLLARPTAAGNALLEVVFAQEEVLPLQITLHLEAAKPVLRDDGLGGDRLAGDRTYSAIVSLDLKAIERQRLRVQELQDRHGQLDMALYQGRRLVRRMMLPADFFKPAQPGTSMPIEWWGFHVGVDAERSLVIRDPRVVEDPARTYDPCTDTGTKMGRWTFGYLMSQIANKPYTGITPAELVRQWVLENTTPQLVNGWTVAPSPGSSIVFDARTWPRLPGTDTPDPARAPFKLLAIVNRVDLRPSGVFGGRHAGEVRFVFGRADCGPATVGSSEKFNVILEYGIAKEGCLAQKLWARQWIALDSHELGSPSYNAALQAITDQFSLADAAPGKPNRSAINQVRTNAGAQASTHWEFREFRLAGKGAAISHLAQSTVAQTPARAILNRDYPIPDALAAFVNANEAAILADTFVVPNRFMEETFLGGAATRDAGGFGWDSALIAAREARHRFALQTCNGCHLDETGTTGLPQQFFHIAPATTGGTASMSGFMTGIDVPDPFDGTPVRHFNELQRRAVDLDGLANNICLNMIDTRDRNLIPLQFVH
jgi:hypothetical protein